MKPAAPVTRTVMSGGYNPANARNHPRRRCCSGGWQGCGVSPKLAHKVQGRTAMKSYDVIDFGAPLRATEKPTPKPQGSEVLLRTLAAGVCHSDLHIWEGWYDLGGGKKLTVKDRGLIPPLTMGHEIVGEVVALGPQATGVKRGDKRLVHPWIGCGTCPVCRRGEEQLCMTPRFLGVHKPGGYADHVRSEERRVGKECRSRWAASK